MACVGVSRVLKNADTAAPVGLSAAAEHSVRSRAKPGSGRGCAGQRGFRPCHGGSCTDKRFFGGWARNKSADIPVVTSTCSVFGVFLGLQGAQGRGVMSAPRCCCCGWWWEHSELREGEPHVTLAPMQFWFGWDAPRTCAVWVCVWI